MRSVPLRFLLCGFLVACAEAGESPDGGGGGQPDGSAAIDAQVFDADPKAPDAMPPKPDAEPLPDAPPGTPDAMPAPDAPPPPPDAAPVPDATPLPDAGVGDCVLGAVGMYTNSTSTPIADNATTTLNVTVSGEGPFLARLGLTTNITHTYAADLDITLISPAGTRVLLTSDNGGSNDNVFNGTRWSDAANTPVVDFAFADGVVATMLTPESAMGAFDGENPNGTWTLEIVDDASIDTGTISSWTLEVESLPTIPMVASHSQTSTPGAAIPDLGMVTDNLVFSALPSEVCDLQVTTAITHTFSGDLEVVLISPMGTRIPLSTRNGGGADDVFNGTFWDDSANAPISEFTFVSGVTATPLTAESALGAARGQNPNGTWSLEIRDDAGADTGTLVSWTLDPVTCSCP